jgi:hypothetical protein
MIRHGRRRGLAMVFVLFSVAMIMAAWGLANRQTVAVVRLKEQIAQREQNALKTRCRRLAVAYGLALLETGLPPLASGQTTYVCEAIINVTDASSQTYVVTFTKVDSTHWSVAARAWVTSDGTNLPQPSSFPPPQGP